MEVVSINSIKPNDSNPRIIKDDKFKKLVQSIKDFPEMLDIRPIVVNTEMVVLGGNMRLKACKEAGLKQVPIIVTDLTEEQQKEFIIKDNVSGGEWDWDMLANEWDVESLNDWGLDVPMLSQDVDYTDKNKEIDIDLMADEMVIKLNYTEAEYNIVKSQLHKIASTPEQAVWKLLGNE